jgi:hypothetical protein
MTYKVEIADEIISRLMAGESVAAICRDPKMPAEATFYNWLADKDNSALLERYVRACEVRAFQMADEIIEIADDYDRAGTNDRRLSVETRKWMMARLAPKKYGDKVELEHGGEVGVRITKIERVIIRPKEQAPA